MPPMAHDMPIGLLSLIGGLSAVHNCAYCVYAVCTVMYKRPFDFYDYVYCVYTICTVMYKRPFDIHDCVYCVYTIYTVVKIAKSQKSKRLHMFTEVDIYALYCMSHCCHTGVKPLLSIYLHRVTGSLDKTRRRRMCLQLPVTLSH